MCKRAIQPLYKLYTKYDESKNYALWQRLVNVHSQNMADFSAQFIRLKKGKCLAALLISEVLDESNDSKRCRGKTRA